MTNPITSKKERGLHVAHLNVRSLWPKIDSVRMLLDQGSLSVCGFSETWLHSNFTNDLLKIDGYSLTRLDRSWTDRDYPGHKKGGGLCLYINDSMRWSEYTHQNCSTKDVECQWIEIRNLHQKRLVIANVYRPPQGCFNRFCQYFLDAFDSLNDLDSKELVIIGDCNVNYLETNDAKTKKLKDMLKITGLRQYINKPTHFGRKDSCLDLILSNSSSIDLSGTYSVNISDHDMVYLTRRKKKLEKSKLTFLGRSYRKYSKDQFVQRLLDEDWNDFDSQEDVNIAWNIMYQVIRRNIDAMCPMKIFRIASSKSPWISNDLLEIIQDKNSQLDRAKRTKRLDDWQLARQMRNECNLLVKRAKARYIQEQAEQDSKDPKKFWKNISDILPNCKNLKAPINLVDTTTKLPVPENDTAAFINNFFVDIGPRLAEQHVEPWVYKGKISETSLDEVTVTLMEVDKACKSIDISKSSAIDGLSSKIIKDAFIALCDKLTKLFNLSLNSGKFPDAWKLATVIPLQKEGDKSDVTNLRPVSLLPLPGKLLEKIIHQRMLQFLESNNLLDCNQGGFRPNRSTIDTVGRISDLIFKAMNNNEITLVAFVDLKKAFDTVDHNLLVKKLDCIGIRTKLLKWSENYLTHRKQATLVNGKRSTNRDIRCGVPQGSILGPLFFLIYVNDIRHIGGKSDIFLFADDTSLLSSNKSQIIARDELEIQLTHLATWCSQNKLTVNLRKTKCMVFGTKSMTKSSKIQKIRINDTELDFVDTYKYLGIILDKSLTFNKHVQQCINSVSHKLFLLSKIRSYISEHMAITIYKTLIVPYLDYGDVLFINASRELLNKLQRLQNKCLRICLRTHPRTSVTRYTT